MFDIKLSQAGMRPPLSSSVKFPLHIVFLYFTRKFSLSFCDSLTDYSLGWIEQFKKLAYLQLKKGANFTNSAILSLLRNLRHMEGQGLKYLNLSECSSLSDKCLQALSQRYVEDSNLLFVCFLFQKVLFIQNLVFLLNFHFID